MSTAGRAGGRRPSKAAVGRELARIRDAEVASSLPGDAAAVIESYASATIPAVRMAVIRPFLLAVMTLSGLAGRESVRKHCKHVSELAAYALDRGLPLDPASVLTTALIDEHVRLGMPGDQEPNRAERRRRLLSLARTVNPGPTAPARLAPIPHSPVKACYLPSERAVIIRVAASQPTEARRRALSAVVGLGFGAGCDSVDLRHMRVGCIQDDGDSGLLVRVLGPRPRAVPVRRDCEALVRAAVAGRPPGGLLIGVKEDRRNTAAQAVERAALYRVPRIEQSRMRSTWLAELMTDAVPIGLIMQAAGLRSARTLADLLPHLGPWMEHKGLAAAPPSVLRGGAR
jgi:hypothetical protein